MKAVNNIQKGWKTTLLGLVIIAAALASVFIKGVAWTTLTIPLILGILLMLAPDTIILQVKAFLRTTSNSPEDTPVDNDQGEPPTIPPTP